MFVEAGELIGYTMLASGFSTEYGRRCIWIEDLYLKPEYQGKGYGSRALDFIQPRTGKPMHFEAPLPEDMEKILTRLHNGQF